MANVQLRNAKKNYGAVDVIKGVDIDINDGEFVVFVGPSGCGKSTLLRMIAGLEEISEGDLYIDEQRMNDVPAAQRGIAMVFQSYAIFPHMTVSENIGFGLTIGGVSKEKKAEKVREAARILQMEHLLDRRPSQLSGGQRQRVAIGRAITRDPMVFLFDEPLSNLDAALRLDMRQEIGKLHKSLNATMIYVTHDQTEAMTLADKIVVLKDGCVQQVGSPIELYHRPRNLFVAGFIGAPAMNFFDVEIRSENQGYANVGSETLNPVDVEIWREGVAGTKRGILGIRPQDLKPVANGGVIRGKVTLVERLGSETIIQLMTSDDRNVLCSVNYDQTFAQGQQLGLDFNPKSAHLFAQEER